MLRRASEAERSRVRCVLPVAFPVPARPASDMCERFEEPSTENYARLKIRATKAQVVFLANSAVRKSGHRQLGFGGVGSANCAAHSRYSSPAS